MSFTNTFYGTYSWSTITIYILDDVPIGNERVVTYEVTNTGANIDSYIVQISDDHSYVLAPDSMNHTLGPGEKTDGNFTLLPNSTIGLLYVMLIKTKIICIIF